MTHGREHFILPAMTKEILQKYDKLVPRYTSYPTAPHFSGDVSAPDYGQWLRDLPLTTPLSLYVHIPFCDTLCWFCGCNTKITRRYDPVASYLETLLAEIDLVADTLGRKHPVDHIHWGGGSPTILTPADTVRLANHIRSRFEVNSQTEFAVEIDPREVGQDNLLALKKAGLTRASIGVQDVNPIVQKAVNRIQPVEVTRRVLGGLRYMGVDAINMDIMYGLPHQTIEGMDRTLDVVLDMQPNRLALFGYAHVPWMKTHQKLIDETALPDAAARFHQSKAAADRLMEHGYRRIGMDHFVRPDEAMSDALDNGTLTRNFQGYTTDHADALVGFGASAIGNFHEGYVQNAVPFGQYAADIQAGELAVRRGIEINDDDRLRRTVIERLMCDLTVALDEICDAFDVGYDYFDQDLAGLSTMRDDGIVDLKGHRISITERGRPLMRNVCAAFDRHLGAGKGRHSRAI